MKKTVTFCQFFLRDCELSKIGWIVQRDKYDYGDTRNKVTFIGRVPMKRLLY